MNRIECPYEELLRQAGYIQVYDGQAERQRENDPTSLKPEDRRFFIRYYQQIKNNHFVNEHVKLVYNMKTGWCEPKHFKKALNGIKQERKMLAVEDLTKSQR